MDDSQLKNTSTIYESNKSKIVQIWSTQRDIRNNFLEGKINQKCIFLVGDTKVGKTTLLYYLSGMKLNLIENQVKRTKEMQPQTIYENAIICNNLSTTEIPNVYSKDEGESSVSLIDMPGMNDNRFVSLISNMFTFDQVFNKTKTVKQIHIAFVISQEMFDAQYIKENIREFIDHFNFEHFDVSKNISLIFTKTQEDIDTLKDRFFEYLNSIKQDIENEEEDERDILRFIDILSGLNSQEELAYCFPSQEPDQEKGENITNLIVQRNHFIENDNASLLNLRMIENILQGSKLKSSSFEYNFIEILNQLQKNIEASFKMAIQLVRFMHKNFVSSLFVDQDSFNSTKEDFAQTYSQNILSFREKEKIKESFGKDQIEEAITIIGQKLIRQQFVYHVDKALTLTLNCKNSEEMRSDDSTPNFTFLIEFAKNLSLVFRKIKKVLKNLEQNEVLVGSIRNMEHFYKWISSQWFMALSKVKSLPKITDKLIENTAELLKLKQETYNEMNKNEDYMTVLKQFGDKSAGENESDTEDQDDQRPLQVYVTMGPTLEQLRQKYIKPDYFERVGSKVDSMKKVQDKRTLRQSTTLKQIIQRVENSEKKIRQFVQELSKEPSKRALLSDEQISALFFEANNFRHPIYVKSVLKNFYTYLNFYIHMIDLEKDRQNNHYEVVELLQCSIGNLCEVLDQYSLYQEVIVLYLFVNNFEKALQVMEKGFDRGTIDADFVEELIKKVDELISKEKLQRTLSIRNQELAAQVYVKCYNYLIAEFSATRQVQQSYQQSLQKRLNQLSPSYQPLTSKTHPDGPHDLTINSSMLDTSSFSFQNILQTMEAMEKRCVNSNLYSIYQDLFIGKQKVRGSKV